MPADRPAPKGQAGRPRNDPADPMVPVSGPHVARLVAFSGLSLPEIVRALRARGVVVSPQNLNQIAVGKHKTTRRSIRDALATLMAPYLSSEWLSGSQGEAWLLDIIVWEERVASLGLHGTPALVVAAETLQRLPDAIMVGTCYLFPHEQNSALDQAVCKSYAAWLEWFDEALRLVGREALRAKAVELNERLGPHAR